MGDKLQYDIFIDGKKIPEEVVTFSADKLPAPESDSLMFCPGGGEVSFTADVSEEDLILILWDIKKDMIKDLLIPKSIIHNRKDDSYIVIWKWGEKTIVRPMSGELSSPYAAFTAALAQIVFGSNSQVNKIVGMTIEPGKRGEKVLTLGEKVKLARKEMKRIRQQEKKE